jgi:hypothetical protein
MKFELTQFNRDVSDDELLQDLVAANATLRLHGRILTSRAYKGIGKYHPTTIAVRFGSWNEGLKRAGLRPAEEKNVPIDSLFDNLKLVWMAKGRQPVYRDMSDVPSLYTASIYNDRFGGWRTALEAFVASIEQEQVELLTFEKAVKTGKVTKRTKRDPPLSLRFFVLKRDRFCCITCGRSPANVAGLILEVDHIVPWSKGGESIEENLQTLCFDCNRGKGVSEV